MQNRQNKKFKLLTESYLPGLSSRTRNVTLMGIGGAALVFLSLCLLYALFVPPLVSGDEPLHLDYAWSVYHHSLPNFYSGPHLPFSGFTVPPVQWVSQHPPLFYLLLAPVVGPLLATHHQLAAIFAGRLESSIFGLLAVLLVPYFICHWGVKNKVTLVASALLAATMVRFIGVSGAIYNDSLGVLLSTISIGVSGLVVLKGPRRKYITWLAIVLALSMLTRAFLLVNLLLGAAAVLIGYWQPGRKVQFVKASVVGAAVILPAMLASGWFYIRNYRLGGTFTGSHNDWAIAHLGRVPLSAVQVVHHSLFPVIYLHLYDDFSNRYVGLVCLVLLVAGLVFLLRPLFLKKQRRVTELRLGILTLLLVGYVCLLLILLLEYATGGGAVNTRYLLPAMLPFAFILSYSLPKLRWKAYALAGILVASGIVNTLINILRYDHGTFVLSANGSLKFPLSPTLASLLLVVFCGLMGAGFVLILSSLFYSPKRA